MNLDRYISMMIQSMHPKQKVTLATIQFYDVNQGRVKSIINLSVVNDAGETTRTRHYNKRQVIEELMKWHRGEEG